MQLNLNGAWIALAVFVLIVLVVPILSWGTMGWGMMGPDLVHCTVGVAAPGVGA